MAVQVRNELKTTSTSTIFPKYNRLLKQKLQDIYESNPQCLVPKVSIWVGGALGKGVYSCIEGDEDVVVAWISDVTDIDSKMVTLVKSGTFLESKIYEELYKIDLSLLV